MARLKIRDTYYRLIDGYNVEESSREVKFSNLTLDFTNKTIADLPLKYQECQLVDINDDSEEIIYTGYVNNFNLPSMKNKKEYRELELELLSPLAMATVRTTDVIGTYSLDSLIRMILVPLISDGFVLKEINVGSSYVSVNYQTETIESALNKLSNKFNIWWYIDKNKNIYVNSIGYIMARNPVFNYNENNKLEGLIDFTPSVNAVDYCNTIDFSNVRMYVVSQYTKRYRYNEQTELFDIPNVISSYPLAQIDTINPGDEIEFDIPIDISEQKILQCYNMQHTFDKYALYISKLVNNSFVEVLNLGLDNYNNLVVPNNVAIQDSYSEDKEFVLVRDSFFPNLIVGMKYNGTSTIDIGVMVSVSALAWVKLRILDNAEIKRNEGLISKTGIVEKQIDMNEQWKFYNELLEIANSYIKKNTPDVEEIKMKIDKNSNFNIGDTITIDRIEYFTKGTFIITDKQITYNNNVTSYVYTLRNTNILENYVDLFRASETEETEEKQYILISSNYIEEKVIEKLEVSKDES